MLADYIYWQYVWAPRWLLRLIWTMQKATFQFFSVKLMLRTLLSHWHKDSVPYKGGTLEKIGMTFAWNMVSRVIGAIVRSIVLAIYLAIEAVLLAVSLTSILLLLTWPLIVIFGFLIGFSLLFF